MGEQIFGVIVKNIIFAPNKKHPNKIIISFDEIDIVTEEECYEIFVKRIKIFKNEIYVKIIYVVKLRHSKNHNSYFHEIEFEADIKIESVNLDKVSGI